MKKLQIARQLSLNYKKKIDENNFFLKALALIFITLKLCGVITWSWWWVLSPLWLVPVICLPIYLICVILTKYL